MNKLAHVLTRLKHINLKESSRKVEFLLKKRSKIASNTRKKLHLNKNSR